MHLRLFKALGFALLLVLPIACGADDGDGDGDGGGSNGGNCADIGGLWSLSGTCLAFQCLISQNGCTVNFDCDSGASSFSGTATDTSVTFQGSAGTCEGTIQGNTISGSCNDGVDTCTYTATQ